LQNKNPQTVIEELDAAQGLCLDAIGISAGACETASVFSYCKYAIAPNRRTVRFEYETVRARDRHRFIETIVFPFELPENPAVHALLRLLHLATGTSYYKVFLPETIAHSYTISPLETSFWNDVFQYGLREFVFTNRLSEGRVARFPEQKLLRSTPHKRAGGRGTALLAIGGGKDSIVAGELLKTLGILSEAYVVVADEVPPQVSGVALELNLNLHIVQRQIDPRLKALARTPGSYNGHVPVSAIFAIIGCIVAVVRGHRYVAVGNEKTASIPHTTWNGLDVNHQWSKSLHFEMLLQRLLAESGCGVDYFSPIRPLSAVSVAAIFAQYPNYFDIFTSDSSSFRIDKGRRPDCRWTTGSAKSLSSFILLLPWLDEATILRIFGRNFLDETSLEEMFLSLLGAGPARTLDCVGTPQELRLSLETAISQGKFTSSYLAQKALDRGLVACAYAAGEEMEEQLKPEPNAGYPVELKTDLRAAIHLALSRSQKPCSSEELCCGVLV